MTQPAIADLLAGTIDLMPGGAPPHGPGPCTALCVPACGGAPADLPGHPTSTAPPTTTAAIEFAGPR